MSAYFPIPMRICEASLSAFRDALEAALDEGVAHKSKRHLARPALEIEAPLSVADD
jgi:hypothetical protein